MTRGVRLEDGPLNAWGDRVVAALFILGAALVVWLLAAVRPDPRGIGTHEKLGMPQCSWPLSYGIPCPTCGVTTAATHLVHLSPIDAVVTQPFGAALAAAGLWLAALAAWSLARRESFVARISLLPFGRILLGGIALLLLAWGYKCLAWDGT